MKKIVILFFVLTPFVLKGQLKSTLFLINIYNVSNDSLVKKHFKTTTDDILSPVDSLLWHNHYVPCEREKIYDVYCYIDEKIYQDNIIDLEYQDSTKSKLLEVTYGFDSKKLFKYFKKDIKKYKDEKKFDIRLLKGSPQDKIQRSFKLIVTRCGNGSN